jgi:LysM repeat protein
MHIKNLFFYSILSLILLFICQNGASQVTVSRSENKVSIEGRMYYMHVVKAGQTLYSVSKAYDLSEAEIERENPGVQSGLQTGQLLKIPFATSRNAIVPTSSPPDTTYRYHEVKPGETMYSISKFYGFSVVEMEKINPAVINNEIKVGQILKIPRIKQVVIEGNFTDHKVKRRETIFGIARMHNISEEVLKRCNPELYENFPKPGQILKIPEPGYEPPAPVPADIQKTDTLSDFHGLKYDTVKIANKYSYYLDSLPELSDKGFNVAYLIPFNFRPIEELTPVEENLKTKDDIVNLDHESNPNDQMLSSRNFLEFMEGSLLALDSLKNEGIAVNVFIFDTKKSPTRTREIISLPEFRKMDLIIGPFYSFNVDIVSEFSRTNCIPMISPLSGEVGPVENNPFLFQLNPGYKTEYERIADFLSGFSDKNIVLIHGIDSLERIKYNYLKEDLLQLLSAKSPNDSVFLREIVYDYTTNASLSQDLQKNLSLTKENIVVVPETDEAFVGTVVTQLYFQLKTYSISVVGMPHWYTFQNIDFLYYHKLSLSYFSPYYFSYDSSNVKHFLKDYRNRFYAEPVTLSKKGSPYAFLGYDISYNFLKIMNTYGKKFILHLDEIQGNEIMNDFHFIPVGGNGGFENHSLVLVKFHENLDITSEHYAIAIPKDSADEPPREPINELPLK